ncbi:MAG: hypothetical protein GXP28_04365 [Planctomycetes bacterium]|nr:hypothetical protein [Planctomycetota bacterium]
MILGFHSIFSTYGFWLPNEPRGSWSTLVASWELAKFGPATKVDTRRSVAARPYDRGLKKRMQAVLQHPPVHLTGKQAQTIALSLANTPYTIHACAILPEHIHLVLKYTSRRIRQAIGHIKSEATKALREQGYFMQRSPWADHGWNVYLDSREAMRRAIKYVENNPVREGKRRQYWSSTIPYNETTDHAARQNIDI